MKRTSSKFASRLCSLPNSHQSFLHSRCCEMRNNNWTKMRPEYQPTKYSLAPGQHTASTCSRRLKLTAELSLAQSLVSTPMSATWILSIEAKLTMKTRESASCLLSSSCLRLKAMMRSSPPICQQWPRMRSTAANHSKKANWSKSTIIRLRCCHRRPNSRLVLS